MLIESTLTKRNFINLNFMLIYSKNWMKIFTAFTCLVFLMSLIASIFSKNDYSLPLLLSIFFLLYIPFFTYIGAIRNFKARGRVTNTTEYNFENEYLTIKGKSFNSQIGWDRIYKVTQTKNWILIWQNKQVGNPILKANISGKQLEKLKEILDGHKVKNNL